MGSPLQGLEQVPQGLQRGRTQTSSEIPQVDFLCVCVCWGGAPLIYLIFLYPSPSLTCDKDTREGLATAFLAYTGGNGGARRVRTCPKGRLPSPSPLHLQPRTAKKPWA